MKQIQYIQYILVFFVLPFYQCTEVYYPEISSDTEALVVEGLITQEAGPYSIKLTMAKPLRFDSTGVNAYAVRLAKVTITENDKTRYTLIENSPGVYTTPANFRAIIGNYYKLTVQTKDGFSYVSNSEKLPPPQTVDSIKSETVTQNYVNAKMEEVAVRGAEVRADLFSAVSNDSDIPSCRFSSVLTYQYWWTYRDRDINGNEIMAYHWVNFGWKNYVLNSFDNITDEKKPSISPVIKNHSLCFIPYEPEAYNLMFSDPKVIFYVRVNQFTLNHDSYRFYLSAKNQLSATGKLFDPINSQLYGNMRCDNNKDRIVLGLFEVSSVTQHSFVVELSNWKRTAKVRYADYVEIPKNNDFLFRDWDEMSAPPANDPTYIPIPLPGWWYHNLY